MSSNKKSLKLKKGGAFEYAKMFQSSLSPCDKKEMLHNMATLKRTLVSVKNPEIENVKNLIITLFLWLFSN